MVSWGSADTLTDYEEKCTRHPITLADGGRSVNLAVGASCHPEGPSGALVSGRVTSERLSRVGASVSRWPE